MTSTLFILNDAPYGSERAYNGLRLAGALTSQDGQQVRVFLMADAVFCAKSGQSYPRATTTSSSCSPRWRTRRSRAVWNVYGCARRGRNGNNRGRQTLDAPATGGLDGGSRQGAGVLSQEDSHVLQALVPLRRSSYTLPLASSLEEKSPRKGEKVCT